VQSRFVVNESSGVTNKTAKSAEPDTAACKEAVTNRQAVRMTRALERCTRRITLPLICLSYFRSYRGIFHSSPSHGMLRDR